MPGRHEACDVPWSAAHVRDRAPAGELDEGFQQRTVQRLALQLMADLSVVGVRDCVVRRPHPDGDSLHGREIVLRPRIKHGQDGSRSAARSDPRKSPTEALPSDGSHRACRRDLPVRREAASSLPGAVARTHRRSAVGARHRVSRAQGEVVAEE